MEGGREGGKEGEKVVEREGKRKGRKEEGGREIGREVVKTDGRMYSRWKRERRLISTVLHRLFKHYYKTDLSKF